jgi:hypothetical protein
MIKPNGQVPKDLAEAFEADAGMGLENITSSDLQIPFLRIIQALSPQLKKSDPLYIESASQGDIINTVTNKVWAANEGVVVLPVHFIMKFLEFVPRSSGGGFVQELRKEDDAVVKSVRDRETGMEILPSGNELVRTAHHYVKIVHEDGELESAVVDMKKTQLKTSRKWLTVIGMQKGPSFFSTYTLSSVEGGNDKGSWYSWLVKQGGIISGMADYNECREFHGTIRKGEALSPPTPPDGALEDQTSDEVPF